jgi:predicted DNA-binding transcriptional regulator AlpA
MENILMVSVPMKEFEELISNCVSRAIATEKAKDSPKLYNLKETAELLKISAPTMRDYKNQKRIPYKQIGRKIWFQESDILRFINENPSFKHSRK